MFKNKKKGNNNMSYFFGGTAVGMAAGLVVGKLLSNVSPMKTQDFQPTASVTDISKIKNINKCSQDNVHNSHFHGTVHSCHSDSKNVSQYEKENYKEGSPPADLSKNLNNDFTHNINDLASKKKYDTKLKNVSCDNKNQVHNISVEDNVECISSNENFVGTYTEAKDYNNYQLFECKTIKEENCAVDSENSDSMNSEDQNFSEEINMGNVNNSNKQDIAEYIRIQRDVKLPEKLNNLPTDLCLKDSTVYKKLPNIRSSVINPNTLQSYVDNASHMATCNSILQFEDEVGEKLLHSPTFDDFYEIDLISSTKQNNLDDNM